MAKKNFEHGRSPEGKEFGENVEIVLKFIRHGERELDGRLTDYGRAITKARAVESGIRRGDFDAIKAIGSTAGPKGPSGMQRSLETADIYAHEIAGDEAFQTRAREVLSYETLVHGTPFEYAEMYASFIPKNFSELAPEEKAAVSKRAQAAVVNQLMGLHTPEAEEYKREVAGSFAYIIDHYRDMAKRLKSGSRVLIPAGTHGGVMECILQQAMTRRSADGKEMVGLTGLNEIGGAFDPSEAFNVAVAIDERGEDKPLSVTFDNGARPRGEFRLDPRKVEELKDHYQQLHGHKR